MSFTTPHVSTCLRRVSSSACNGPSLISLSLCMFACFAIYLIYNFKIQAQGYGWVEAAYFPLVCATDSHLLCKNQIFVVNKRSCLNRTKIRNETVGTWLTFSETQVPLELSETQGPMAPQSFSSLDVCNTKRLSIRLRNSMSIRANAWLSRRNNEYNCHCS